MILYNIKSYIVGLFRQTIESAQSRFKLVQRGCWNNVDNVIGYNF